MNTARRELGAAGIQTAALAFGGNLPGNSAATEEYDGSTWTSTTSMATARKAIAGLGTQSSALGMGGETTVIVATTEEWTGAGAAVTKTITVS
jgi:hypothetical protein